MRESTGVASDTGTPPNEAKRVLKVKEGKAANGEPVMLRIDRVRYEEIRKDLLEHYATTGRRNPAELGWRLKHLDRFFSGRRLADITEALVTSYVARRQEQGAANGTINRELATLSPMMRLAYRHRKAARLLLVERLKENAPRAGFFTYRPMCRSSRRSRTASAGAPGARSCRSSGATSTLNTAR